LQGLKIYRPYDVVVLKRKTNYYDIIEELGVEYKEVNDILYPLLSVDGTVCN